MTYPILYSFRRCPYAMRARMAIAVSGQVCELREVVLRDKPAAMLQASAKGTVPVLVLPNGKVIDESLDIMRWALQFHDPQHWLSGIDATSAHVAECDGPFKRHLDRYKYPNRYQLASGIADRDKGALYLAMLEVLLGRQQFLNGAHFGFADATIAPFVRQYAHTNPAWFAAQPWPLLQHWLACFEGAELFATAMQKFEKWETSSPLATYPASP